MTNKSQWGLNTELWTCSFLPSSSMNDWWWTMNNEESETIRYELLIFRDCWSIVNSVIWEWSIRRTPPWGPMPVAHFREQVAMFFLSLWGWCRCWATAIVWTCLINHSKPPCLQSLINRVIKKHHRPLLYITMIDHINPYWPLLSMMKHSYKALFTLKPQGSAVLRCVRQVNRGRLNNRRGGRCAHADAHRQCIQTLIGNRGSWWGSQG